MSLGTLYIDQLAVSPNLVLAPMSGVTNICFRDLIRRENPGKVGLTVTEFISIEGLVRQNKQSLRMMRYREEERPISVQIFGHSIANMVEAAQMVEDTGADIVDINCGCPVPKVVRRGGGCELMRQPAHLAKMLSAVKAAVGIPLTLKIRSGWDESSRNAVEIAKIAEDSGVGMLAVHGRTRSALYRGLPDWEIISEVVDAVKIPVVGSGNVTDTSSARAAFASGVSALMIGRAALANPWVFSEIAAGLNNEIFPRPSDRETAAVLQRYMDLLLTDMPEKAVIGRMKQFTSQVTRRISGSAPIRRELCRSSSLDRFREVLAEWTLELDDGASVGDHSGVGPHSESSLERPSEFGAQL